MGSPFSTSDASTDPPAEGLLADQSGVLLEGVMNHPDGVGPNTGRSKTHSQVPSRIAASDSSGNAPGASAPVGIFVPDQKLWDLSADLDEWMKGHDTRTPLCVSLPLRGVTETC